MKTGVLKYKFVEAMSTCRDLHHLIVMSRCAVHFCEKTALAPVSEHEFFYIALSKLKSSFTS